MSCDSDNINAATEMIYSKTVFFLWLAIVCLHFNIWLLVSLKYCQEVNKIICALAAFHFRTWKVYFFLIYIKIAYSITNSLFLYTCKYLLSNKLLRSYFGMSKNGTIETGSWGKKPKSCLVYVYLEIKFD